MKRFSILICISIVTLFMSSCKQPEPDWTYSFIVFEGNIYEVSQNIVKQTDSEIGVIEKKIKDEKLYSGIFSNVYPTGTKLFKILNVDIKDSIAVETESGQRLQADYQGEYGK